jgi:thiol-disulfide isomerase/thioredoxin
MSPGLWAFVFVMALSTAFGLWRRATDGRFRSTARTIRAGKAVPGAAGELAPAQHLSAADLGRALGERATLLQFSSAFCAPCHATRVVLGDVAENTPGVVHVEVSAEERIELIQRFDVRRTPTLLVLDSAGVVRHRATGAPHKSQVLAALATV